MSQNSEDSQDRSGRAPGSLGHVRRREFSEPGSRRKDTNLAARAQLIKMLGYSSYAVFPGLILGVLLANRYPGGVIWIAVAGLGFPLAVFLLGLMITTSGGRAAATLHNPSGCTTPFKRQYSAAETLKVRGEYAAAIDAYEGAAAEHPDDPRPLIEIARIQRDALDDPEAAASAFKRALGHPSLEAGQRFLVTRELCEVYTHRMDEPRRALPILARMAEEQAGTPPGEWAAEELVEVKALVFGEERG